MPAGPAKMGNPLSRDEFVPLVHLRCPLAADPLEEAAKSAVEGGVGCEQEPDPVAAGLALAALAKSTLRQRDRLCEAFRARGAELDPQQALHRDKPKFLTDRRRSTISPSSPSPRGEASRHGAGRRSSRPASCRAPRPRVLVGSHWRDVGDELGPVVVALIRLEVKARPD